MHEIFYKIFASYERAHATYIFEGFDDNGKKIGHGNVVRQETNPANWQNHLDGTYSLGAFPLLDDNTCLWGAIDIDDMKGLTHKDLVERIIKFELPLICFRSASGNAHLYAFFKERLDATKVREKLISWSSQLGFANSELFPKQTYRIGKEDYGNWLNLPYYKGADTDRYAFDDVGDKLNPEEFLKLYKNKVISIVDIKPAYVKDSGMMFEFGPPCLKHIEQHEQGTVEGARNNFIFNAIVFLKKKMPETWKSYVHEFNINFCQPILDHSEIERIIKSLEKKDYEYKCKDAPIAQFCNKPLCKKQKYGIGNSSSSSLEIDNMTKFEGDPVKWIVEVQGVRIELSTKELMNQGLFVEKVTENVNSLIKRVPKDAWEDLLEHAFNRLTASDIIPVPEDASNKGQFKLLVEEFCTREAKVKDEIFARKAWWDDDGFIYFSSRGIISELDKARFKYESTSKLYHMLRAMGGDNKLMKVKGKNMRVWFIPHFEKFKHEPNPVTKFEPSDNPHKVEKEF